MNNQTEKRKYPRITTHIPVKYRRLTDPEGEAKSSVITADISEAGIRFKVAEFISMACRLILELDVPMFSRPIKAISRVAWIAKASQDGNYEIGNQFLEMSKEDKELISEYVNSLIVYNDGEEKSPDPS